MADRKENMKILIIENNPADRNLVLELIKKIATDTTTDNSETLEEACLKVSENTYHLIFLELHLPDSSGRATITRLKEALKTSSLNKETPVIVLTGVSNYKIGKEAIKKDVKDYVIKDTMDLQTMRRCINFAGYKRCLPKKKRFLWF